MADRRKPLSIVIHQQLDTNFNDFIWL